MTSSVFSQYNQAREIMQGSLTNRLVMNDAVYPHWIDSPEGGGECFWYIRDIKNPKLKSLNGKQYRLVNSATATNVVAFDHKALAEALEQVLKQAIDPGNLPLKDLKLSLSPLKLHFQAADRSWLYEPEGGGLKSINVETIVSQGLCSPDGKNTVFIRKDNLWLRDNSTGEEQALTRDGSEDCSYGRMRSPYGPHGWDVQGQWSKDSNLLLSLQFDTRGVPEIPLVHYAPLDGSKVPTLSHIKSGLNKKDKLPVYRLIVININTGQVQAADQYPLMPLIFGQEDFGVFRGNPLAWWSSDSRHAFFIDVSLGSKAVRVIKWDVQTDVTQAIIEEKSDTNVMLNDGLNQLPLFLSLPESDELIWYSERTGWGHLYLYDLANGKLSHQITGVEEKGSPWTSKQSSDSGGNWLVRKILHHDAGRRELLLQTSGRDSNVSPYYRDICRVNIDTGVLTTLISGNFEYEVYESNNLAPYFRMRLSLDSCDDIGGVSPCGQYLVTTFSRVDTIPVSVLIDRDGSEILALETADISALPEGWQWPEPVKLKAADDQTDIYGAVFRPPGFSSDQQYPVLELAISMNPYSGLPQGAFINDASAGLHYLWGAAYAALGFIVVTIEGRGTPKRGKTFRDYGYGDLAKTNDLKDRIAGLQQLAIRYPYMDLDRVGITGTDGPTNAVFALLDYPDFYKTAVLQGYTEAGAGRGQFEVIHPRPNAAAVTPEIRSATDYVDSLEGKLLLILGGLNPGAMMCGLQLIEALQKANKDVDLICMPNLGNNMPNYTMRRTWDYLVRHLQAVEPPQHFEYLTGVDFIRQDLDPECGSDQAKKTDQSGQTELAQ